MSNMSIWDFDFKPGTRDYFIAQRLLEGDSREDILRRFFPQVGVMKAWTFSENTGAGHRRPKPMEDQYRLFLYSTNVTIGKMVDQGWVNPEPVHERRKWTDKSRTWIRWRANFIDQLVREDREKKENPEPSVREIPGFKPTPKPSVEEILADPERELIAERVEPKPDLPEDQYDSYGNLVIEYEYNEDETEVITTRHHPKVSYEQRLRQYYKLLMRARSFVIERELAGTYLDFISTRALKDGCNAIIHGIDELEIMEAVTKTWPQDSKNELKGWVKEWEPKAVSNINWERYPSNLPGAHRFLGYIMCLAESRIPIFLVGPSGCGKSFLARDLADVLEMDYGELPLTAGATPSWLVGAETMSGYKSRPFVDIYRDGGVFCFEEIDAADSNMLLLVNNALANEFLTNPVTGEEIEKHPDFIPIATANTWGLGANRQFTGRERLDAATLDRWRVGRVEMDYDVMIEEGIVEFYIQQAERIHRPRKVKAVKRA